jgi:hypothetical protein
MTVEQRKIRRVKVTAQVFVEIVDEEAFEHAVLADIDAAGLRPARD